MEVVKLRRIYNNQMKILLQDTKFLEVIQNIVKYCIDFESQQGVTFLKAMAEDVVEDMTRAVFMPNIESASYSL